MLVILTYSLFSIPHTEINQAPVHILKSGLDITYVKAWLCENASGCGQEDKTLLGAKPILFHTYTAFPTNTYLET